jgi:hypothetical protein
MSDQHGTAPEPDDTDAVDDLEDGYEVDLVEIEVAVVPVEIRDADDEAEDQADEADEGLEGVPSDAASDDPLDEALDHVDDGAEQVRDAHLPTGPGELPLLIPGRDRFARLEDVPVTGDARVDAATARLDELADLPTADHVAVYDDVHQRLQDALADADPA